MNGNKAAIASLGFWGPLITVIALGAKAAGYDLGDTSGLANEIVAAIAAVAGLYGRLRATAQITGLLKAK